MKKKNLSFMTLFMLTATLIGGCSCNKQSDENVNSLVIKVGEKEYSAKDLYNELLSTGTGANEAFAKVLRLVVEQSMETTPNIQGAADLAAESFEEEVKNDAATNGTSLDESRKKLLKDKGYETVDQMKSDIIYERKLDLITDTYWEDNKAAIYDEYVENRLPYLVRHILVNIDDTNANKIANNVNVSQTDAKKIVEVVKDLESGGDFIETAHLYSEDTGSTGVGGAYYMDNTYGVAGPNFVPFVDEFVYGTYAFDAYTTRTEQDDKVTYTFGKNQAKFDKLVGLNDTETFATYYENGFNFVDMSIVDMLSSMASEESRNDKEYFPISNYEQDGTSTSGDMNSSENYYARSILFNRAFNKPGVSVVGYQTEQEAIDAGAKHYVEYKVDNETKYILADEHNNAIFFVAARAGTSIRVHFFTISVSALDDLENAKKFFTLTPDYEDDYVTYVELMANSDSPSIRNTYINELESYVKSYVTKGVGNTNGEESLLKYAMVHHYMKKNNIKYMREELEKAVESYIANKEAYLSSKLLNSLVDAWDGHTNKLSMSMNELITRDIKPYECAVLFEKGTTTRNNPYKALNTNNDALCRYVYGTGYQVKLNYFYENENSTETSESFQRVTTTNSNTLFFDDDSNHVEYVSIGSSSSHIELAKPKVKDGYIFEGWYYDKDLTKKVPEDHDGDQYVDLSESRIENQTIFFAKVVKGVSLNYVYVDSTGAVVNGPDSNTNPERVKYDENASDHTLNIDLAGFVWEAGAQASSIKVARSGQGFNTADLPQVVELTSSDLGKVVTVYVIVTGDTGGNE